MLSNSILPAFEHFQSRLQSHGNAYLEHAKLNRDPVPGRQTPSLAAGSSVSSGFCGAAAASCHSAAAALHVPIQFMKKAEPAAHAVGSYAFWAPSLFAYACGGAHSGAAGASEASQSARAVGGGIGSLAILASGSMLAVVCGLLVGISAIGIFTAGILAIPVLFWLQTKSRNPAPNKDLPKDSSPPPPPYLERTPFKPAPGS